MESIWDLMESPDTTEQGWAIHDDSTADWAVRKIADERAELERIRELANAEIERIQARVAEAEKRCESGTSYLSAKLADYFDTVPHKATKTQETYKLLNGTLKVKRGGYTMEHDPAALLEYLKRSGAAEMIQVVEKPRWGEYKKRLTIQGNDVVDTETGEVVEGVTVAEKPDVFTVEV